jgi:phosphate transport system permease protein
MSVTSRKDPQVAVRPVSHLGRARRIRPMNGRDIALLASAIGAGLALTWLVYSRLLPLQGLQGFLICWVASFLAFYYAAVRETDGKVIARDRVMTALITVMAIGIVAPLAIIVGYVGVKGLRYLHLSFFSTTMASVGPSSPASQSGGLQAIVGTVEQVGIAMAISVPLGILTAVYLNEVHGRLRRPVRIFVDAMSGVPSIVAGLFIYAVLVAGGGQFSGFAAAIALSILMLPTVTRTCEVVLRLVPDGLREASLAMGAPEWRTVWGVVLPTARSGIITAMILGVARVIGETAPLLMTSLGNPDLNLNPFRGPQASLPLASFKLFTSSQQADISRAWTFAVVLLMLVLVLFVMARRSARTQFGR